MKKNLIARILSSLLITFFSIIEISNATDDSFDYSMEVSQTEFKAHEYVDDVIFTFTVGDSGLRKMRFQLHTRNDVEASNMLWSIPQNTNPVDLGYVQTWTDSQSASVEIDVATENKILVRVSSGILSPGDHIYVSYTGYAQSIEKTFQLPVQYKTETGTEWIDINEFPTLDITSDGEAVTLLSVIPTDIQDATSFDLAVSVLDKYGNWAHDYTGTINFVSTDPLATLPSQYTFTIEDNGVHVFEDIRFNTIGFQRIIVNDVENNLVGKSNWAKVTLDKPAYVRYFGDTQFHTGHGANYTHFGESSGGDHAGQFTNSTGAYAFAKRVNRLDWASVSEHDAGVFDDSVWESSKDVSESFYEPESFTTFFGYEYTPNEVDPGHNVVMFKDIASSYFDHRDENYDTLPELYNALDNQGLPALVIPHCMGDYPNHKMWDIINNDYRKIGEIYSHKNRAPLEEDSPQLFELGIDNDWSYQYGWDKGHKIGVIGSTDNHLERPGQNDFSSYSIGHPGGLAVALAEANDRSNIWDSLENRRTYATTGTRIYIDFKINGYNMGEEISAESPLIITGSVAGLNDISGVEIVKHDSLKYSSLIPIDNNDNPEIFELTYTEKFDEDSFYYLRVKEVDRISHDSEGQIMEGEMAWSSPIWVNYIGTADKLIIKKALDGSRQKTKFYHWDDTEWIFEESRTSDKLKFHNNRAIAMGDYDNDGVDELLLKNKNIGKRQLSKFYEWSGTNWVWEATSESDGFKIEENFRIAMGDYDNDGVDELVVKVIDNDKSKFYSWSMTENKWVLDHIHYNDGKEINGDHTIAMGDYDGDGVDELLVKNKKVGSRQISEFYEWAGKKWVWEATSTSGGYKILEEDEIAMGKF